MPSDKDASVPAVERVVKIIRDTGWLSPKESWSYGEGGAEPFYDTLDPRYDIRPVAEEIVAALSAPYVPKED